MNMSPQKYIISVIPYTTVYFDGEFTLGSPNLSGLNSLCSIPGVNLNFSRVHHVDEVGLGAVRHAIELANRNGNYPTLSGMDHNLLLMWTLLLVAEAPNQDAAYRA
jgi:hypothetical protein